MKAPARLLARSSESIAPMKVTPSSTSQPSTAQYLSRHMPIAAATITPANTRPLATGRSPSTSQPESTRITLAIANSRARTADSAIGHGRSPGFSGTSAARAASSFSRARA